jgi:hypothetical protein
LGSRDEARKSSDAWRPVLPGAAVLPLLLIAVGQSDAKPILMIPAVLIITGAVIATSRSRNTSR